MEQRKKLKLVVLASTFPRWKNDSVPSFVQDYVLSIADNFKEVTVVAPHYKGAKTNEKIGRNVKVKRFRYFFPAKGENIVYDGHAAKKVSKNPVYILKLFLFMVSGLYVTLRTSVGRDKVINAHWLVPQGWFAIMTKFITRNKVVITIHGGDVFTLNSAIMVRVKAYLLKKADAVVVNSSATRQVCENIYPHREYQVIPMGINVNRPHAARERNVEPYFNILFVGRLSPEKGVIYLCKAVKLLNTKYNGKINVRIVGSGPEASQIESYIRKNKLEDVINMAGWRQQHELKEFYRGADIFVGPSLQDKNGWMEAFGLVFAEAAAFGLPVIATNTGGIVDIVEDDVTGFLVKQKDHMEIANKVELLMKDEKLRKRMGRAGEAKVRTNFSWPVISKKYSTLIYEVQKTESV